MLPPTFRLFFVATTALCTLTGAASAQAPNQAAETPANIVALRAARAKNWAYTLAVQAATWGAPLVIMYDLRYNDAVGPKAKARPNTVWRMEDISTPELSVQEGYVTPNVNVIYGFGFLDLRREPVILKAPDSHGRYYMVEIVDMWTNAFAYVGGRATGFGGGTSALVGPGWSGTLPEGVRRIDCPTPWVLIQPRVDIYDNGKLDLGGARTVLEAIQPIGLSAFQGTKAPPSSNDTYPAPEVTDEKLPVSDLNFKDPLQFWELLATAMAENPPPKDQIDALLPMFRLLGLELGKPWDRRKVPPAVLAAMSEAVTQIPLLVAAIPVGRFDHGAFVPAPTIGNFGTDYATRALIARAGLTANTPAEAVYWTYLLDVTGQQPLTGDKKYTLTFTSEMPYDKPGFWSITMYNITNNYTVPNPINRYMLGSDSSGLKHNPDGSLTIYIQKESPGPDKESNWLPCPSGRFYATPRAYMPGAALVRMLTDPSAWPIPGVVPTP